MSPYHLKSDDNDPVNILCFVLPPIDHKLELIFVCDLFLFTLGAVHILRQPPEGGEGVKQMLTIADEGGTVAIYALFFG